MQERGLVSPLTTARRWLLILGVAAAVVAADQASKTWALDHLVIGVPRHVFGTLQWNLTRNNGIAFSQVTGAPVLVTAVALVVLATLVVVAVRTRGTYWAVVLGLVIGGAVGNLADRVFRHGGGSVIDFIDLQWWPVFNIADASVSVGVVLALARGILWPASKPEGRAEE